MERKNYVVAVDLGSSNVVVAVAVKHDDGQLELKSVVSKPLPAESVTAGQIYNHEQAGQAIIAACNEAGEAAGIRITEAYAGISGEFVRCACHTDYVFVKNPQLGVAEEDVQSLFGRMHNLQAPEKELIMAQIPQNYVVDDNQEVQNPIGSFGRKLSSTFNFVLCHTTPMERLSMALKRANVEVAQIIPNPLAVAESVLSPDEKEEGVALVDIGAGVTDVTIYHRNVVRYVASIPIGASAINQDISTLGVPGRFVESLKQQYGSAVAENASETKLVRVPGRTAREAREILLRNLATVIEARAMDIIDFVKEEIKISGYAGKLGYGIVLTGGSANLKELDELFRRAMKMEVRVAVPEFGITEESAALVADPQYAAVVGLLIKGAALSVGGTAYVPLPPKPQPVAPAEPVSVPQQPAAPVQPAQPTAPVQAATPAQPTAPVQPVAPKVEPTPAPQPAPAVQPQPVQAQPAQSVQAQSVASPQSKAEPKEEPQPTRSGGFKSWLKKITEGFETVGDEEI